jgi:hypothetical protein
MIPGLAAKRRIVQAVGLRARAGGCSMEGLWSETE